MGCTSAHFCLSCSKLIPSPPVAIHLCCDIKTDTFFTYMCQTGCCMTFQRHLLRKKIGKYVILEKCPWTLKLSTFYPPLLYFVMDSILWTHHNRACNATPSSLAPPVSLPPSLPPSLSSFSFSCARAFLGRRRRSFSGCLCCIILLLSSLPISHGRSLTNSLPPFLAYRSTLDTAVDIEAANVRPNPD